MAWDPPRFPGFVADIRRLDACRWRAVFGIAVSDRRRACLYSERPTSVRRRSCPLFSVADILVLGLDGWFVFESKTLIPGLTGISRCGKAPKWKTT
jgi:hypothetical protein